MLTDACSDAPRRVLLMSPDWTVSVAGGSTPTIYYSMPCRLLALIYHHHLVTPRCLIYFYYFNRLPRALLFIIVVCRSWEECCAGDKKRSLLTYVATCCVVRLSGLWQVQKGYAGVEIFSDLGPCELVSGWVLLFLVF